MNQKYSLSDFEAPTDEEQKLKALVAVANELHNIHVALRDQAND